MSYFDHEFINDDGIYIVKYEDYFKLWIFVLGVIPIYAILVPWCLVADWLITLFKKGIDGIKYDYDYKESWGMLAAPFRFISAVWIERNENEDEDE